MKPLKLSRGNSIRHGGSSFHMRFISHPCFDPRRIRFPTPRAERVGTWEPTELDRNCVRTTHMDQRSSNNRALGRSRVRSPSISTARAVPWHPDPRAPGPHRRKWNAAANPLLVLLGVGGLLAVPVWLRGHHLFAAGDFLRADGLREFRIVVPCGIKSKPRLGRASLGCQFGIGAQYPLAGFAFQTKVSSIFFLSSSLGSNVRTEYETTWSPD